MAFLMSSMTRLPKLGFQVGEALLTLTITLLRSHRNFAQSQSIPLRLTMVPFLQSRCQVRRWSWSGHLISTITLMKLKMRLTLTRWWLQVRHNVHPLTPPPAIFDQPAAVCQNTDHADDVTDDTTSEEEEDMVWRDGMVFSVHHPPAGGVVNCMYRHVLLRNVPGIAQIALSDLHDVHQVRKLYELTTWSIPFFHVYLAQHRDDLPPRSDVEFHPAAPSWDTERVRSPLFVPPMLTRHQLLRALDVFQYSQFVQDTSLVWLNHNLVRQDDCQPVQLCHGDFVRIALPPPLTVFRNVPTRCIARMLQMGVHADDLEAFYWVSDVDQDLDPMPTQYYMVTANDLSSTSTSSSSHSLIQTRSRLMTSARPRQHHREDDSSDRCHLDSSEDLHLPRIATPFCSTRSRWCWALYCGEDVVQWPWSLACMWHTTWCFSFCWLAQLACWLVASVAWSIGSFCRHRDLHGWSWSHRWSWTCCRALDSGSAFSHRLSQHFSFCVGQYDLEWSSTQMGIAFIHGSLWSRVGRTDGLLFLLPSAHATQPMPDLVSSTGDWHGWWFDCSSWSCHHFDSHPTWTYWRERYSKSTSCGPWWSWCGVSLSGPILLLYVNLLHIDHIFDNIAVILYVEHALQLCSYQCLTSTQAIQPVLLTIGFCRLACQFCSMRKQSTRRDMQKWNGWHGICVHMRVCTVKTHVVSSLTLSSTCGYKIYNIFGVINGYHI